MQAQNKTAMTSKKGKAGSLDEHIGARLKQRRSLMGMTQEKLADAVGITFQQIQKYENGANRVSAGRLFEFSNILNVPLEFFYENYEGVAAKSYGFADNEQESFEHKTDIMQEKETLELIRTYYSIKNPKLRKDLFNFIRSMVDNLKAQDSA